VEVILISGIAEDNNESMLFSIKFDVEKIVASKVLPQKFMIQIAI
jgi:hypothetical protein